MKIDFNQKILQRDGQPIKDLTLASVCVNALDMGSAEKRLDGNESHRRFRLASRLYVAAGTEGPHVVDLSVDDVKLLKDAVADAGYVPLVVGQVYDMLDPVEDEPRPKKR